MEELELIALKGLLTGDEITAARSRIAEEIKDFSDLEKAAFLKGLKLGASVIQISDHLVAVRCLSALIVAASE